MSENNLSFKFQKYLEKPLKYMGVSNSRYYGYKCEVFSIRNSTELAFKELGSV